MKMTTQMTFRHILCCDKGKVNDIERTNNVERSDYVNNKKLFVIQDIKDSIDNILKIY